ncbi:MAG TPA: protein kinase [Planctomycetota bacterium]
MDPLLLGQIAVQEGRLTPAQLAECVRLQAASDTPRKLGSILVDRGHLTPAALDALIEIQRRRLATIAADPERGGLFGQLALRAGAVSQLQLDEALREQQALAAAGGPEPLGRILVRKGWLNEDGFLELLRRQRGETVRCPSCETLFDTREQAEGAKFVCARCGTLVRVPGRTGELAAPAEIPAENIGRYQILEKLGQGGMGVVYKALHRDLNRVFALKVLRQTELTTLDTVRRFQREARLAARLKHPHVIAVHDAGEERGFHYIAMEYVDGDPLSARLISRKGRQRENLVLMEKISRAVAYAHSQGVIHRDLKPANVMVDRAGEPHIMDFGLAKEALEGSLLTRSGAFLGTPFYMAPEQIEGRGPADAQSDVYALGVILYEILTGHLPHVGANSAETFNRIISRDPLPVRAVNAAIHPDLETVCLKAIDRDRGRRYASADPMADDLRRFLDGEPILARPVGLLGRLLRKARRRPALALATVLALTCAALGVELLRPEASALEVELRHDPDNPSLHEAQGLLRLRAGLKAEALKSFERAIELAPERRARLQPRVDACRVP